MNSDIYKCSKCGNVVAMLNYSGTPPNCHTDDAGQPLPMTLLAEKTADAATEKHVPFVEKQGNGIKVTVGKAALHPMLDGHYIQWIEVITIDDRSSRKFLAPGQQPVASFEIKFDDVVRVREYCNLHELWKS